MGKRLALFLMIGVMILGALAACGGSTTPAESPAASAPAASSPAASAPAAGGESPAASGGATGGAAVADGKIEVDATEMSFTPTNFTAPANSTVTVTLKNTGAVLHDFVIEKDGSGKKVTIEAEPGKTASAEVKTGPAGTLEFFCSQPGHKDAGMDGHITVQ